MTFSINTTDGLSSPPTPTIGVLAGWPFYEALSTYNFLESNFLDSVLRGIRAAADQYNCHLLIACGIGAAHDDDVARPAWPVPAHDNTFLPVGPWNTNGLIVFNPLTSKARSKYIQRLRQQGHPIVFLGTAEKGSAVAVDNEGGIRQAIYHLIGHGHHSIAFIAGNKTDETGDGGERLQAYLKYVHECNLRLDDRLLAYGTHSIRGGRAAMQTILASGVECTAVLASNDESAIGAMEVLREMGYQIPNDMAVIGFDDRPAALAQNPPLTTVHNTTFERGYRALELLAGMIRENHYTQESIIINSATHLVIRQSCGCEPDELFDHKLQFASYLPPDTDYATVLNTIARPILAEARRLSSATLFGMCRTLFDAFASSLQSGDTVTFRRTLNTILEEIEKAGENAYTWQKALPILAEYFATQENTGKEERRLIRAMLSWAQLTLSEQLQRYFRGYIFDQSWIASRAAMLNAYLVETISIEEIYEVLTRHLPSIGIEHAVIAYFDDETAVAESPLHLRALLNPTSDVIHVPIHAYSPLMMVTEETSYHLALFPLIVDQQQIGFVIFQTENFAICEIIIRQIAAAMRSVHLYQQAEEGRRLAEEARRLAEEANQTKTRFLSMVSHELRTPLSLVVGLSEMLVQDTRQGQILLDTPRTRQIERIHTSAQHLDGLIQDVLDLTHGDIDQLAFAPEPLILQDVLAPTLSIGEQMAIDKGLQWHEDVSKHPITVYGDRGRLRQIVLNLVNNAIKFTAEGDICLTLKPNSNETMVKLVVTDSGLGVPEADRDTIFEPFQRSERTVKRGYGGLGLGLAICKHFVSLHKGEIGLCPTTEGQSGASFFIHLPILAIALTALSAPDTLAAQQENEPHILIIESPSISAQALVTHLAQEGYQVRVMRNERDETILAVITESVPQAVVFDAHVNSEQGWRLFRRLKNNRHTRDIPILFYDLAQEEDTGSMISLDYMSKPVGITELMRVLQRYGPFKHEASAAYTILIVDDDPGILEMHTQMIHRQWPMYQIHQAGNGRDALAYMRKSPPNLVLLDLMMPEVDGFAVLAAMRQDEVLNHIPVIVLTASVLTEAEMDQLYQGVTMVLKKGVFTIEETLHHIQDALARERKLGDEKRRLVRHAMAYIHERFTEQITREDIAQHVSASKGYLSRSFREELGLGLITYLNRYRVNQAKRLLVGSQQTITDVAHAVGFTDGNYFSRVFRREVGESPKVYRAHHGR